MQEAAHSLSLDRVHRGLYEYSALAVMGTGCSSA